MGKQECSLANKMCVIFHRSLIKVVFPSLNQLHGADMLHIATASHLFPTHHIAPAQDSCVTFSMHHIPSHLIPPTHNGVIHCKSITWSWNASSFVCIRLSMHQITRTSHSPCITFSSIAFPMHHRSNCKTVTWHRQELPLCSAYATWHVVLG